MNLHPEFIAIIDLFSSGLRWLHTLEKDKKCARYSDWKKLMKSARPNDDSLDDKRLIWLWGAITTEPSIKHLYGNSIISVDDEWKEIEPFECLPEKSNFGIFFKGFQSYGYPVKTILKDIIPDAEADIQGPLFLRPGKALRLECCDVPTVLKIRLSGKISIEQEAIAFKVEEDDIEIHEPDIFITVKSLNHAYTKASLRLQPHRRGPGGKAYNHIGLRSDNDLYEPLEEIRRKNEERIWKELKG